MGNYKKTVRCSYCHSLGHNRVTCEFLELKIHELRSKHGMSHPKVEAYDNYKKWQSEKSVINARKKRSCTYCKEMKHNRRTCSVLKEDMARLKSNNKKWRKNVLDKMNNLGVGIGSLVVHSNHLTTIENPNSAWVLTNIDWHNISWITDNKKPITVVLVKNPAITRTLSLDQLLNRSETYFHRWNVISSSSDLTSPSNWNRASDPVFGNLVIEILRGIDKSEYDLLFLRYINQKSMKFLINEEYYEEG